MVKWSGRRDDNGYVNCVAVSVGVSEKFERMP